MTSYIKNSDLIYHTNIDKKLKELSNSFEKKLHLQNLTPSDQDNVDKLDLLKQIQNINELKREFIKEQLNLIEKEEKIYSNEFRNRFAHLEMLLNDYKSLVKEYQVFSQLIKAILLSSFSMRNELETYEMIINIDLKAEIQRLANEKQDKAQQEVK